MAGLAIALVVFTLAGAYGPWEERYLRGLAIAGTAMFVGGVAGVPVMVMLAIVVVVAIGHAGARARRPAAVHHEPARPRARAPLATAIMLLPVAIIFAASLTRPLADFDGRVFWVLKAKAIAHEQSIDGPFFRGETTWDPRNRYPLLMPLNGGAVMTIARDLDDGQIRGMYALTFLALLLVIRRRVNPWLAAVVAWIPQFVIVVEGGATSAYSDIPMAAFAACALFDIVSISGGGTGATACPRGEPESTGEGACPPTGLGAYPLTGLGIWLAALTLTKSEGLIYAAVLLVAAAFMHRRRIVPAAALFAVAAASLIVWRTRVPQTDGEDFLTRLPVLPHNLHRLLPALEGVARHAFDVTKWGFFWIAVAICIVIALRRGQWLSPAILGAMLSVFIAVFMVTAWPIDDLINSSVDRLLMQLTGPAVLILSASARSR